jgi:hypothetical protein
MKVKQKPTEKDKEQIKLFLEDIFDNDDGSKIKLLVEVTNQKDATEALGNFFEGIEKGDSVHVHTPQMISSKVGEYASLVHVLETWGVDFHPI